MEWVLHAPDSVGHDAQPRVVAVGRRSKEMAKVPSQAINLSRIGVIESKSG